MIWDDLASPVRAWVIGRWGPQSKAATLVSCPWCLSWWWALAWWGCGYLASGHPLDVTALWAIPAGALTISYLYAAAQARLGIGGA
ncbi:hypothetical protein [Bailinhaonella thermotolerans]|uniref:hypothetical protein n=1 Tax=Bailinhaonella thermotolerans TaxID=1070861 RepID=UPI0011C3972E|nr:hypothetical protein [Bailinhaonella thermotolerans]